MARKFNPKYKVNLIEVFNRAYANDDVRLRSAIRPTLQDPTFKMLYGSRVINEIEKRTLSGVDRNDKPFKGYDKDYKNSKIFKIYKGGKIKPDLKLTGEMLASMEAKQTAYTISVEMIGDNNKAKAHGHINGGGVRNSLPIRDFLGLPRDVEESLLRKTLSDYLNENIEAFADVTSASLRGFNTGADGGITITRDFTSIEALDEL